MKQPSSISEEELILHYYGESEQPEVIDEAMQSSSELARSYAELRLVLDAIDISSPPARSDLYGHEVWKRVYPRLERARWSGLPKAAAWALAASLLIVASFWAGRETAPDAGEPDALTELAHDRILLVAVADHLQRTQFLLLELANSTSKEIGATRLTSARDLQTESRLFRQAAQKSGEGEVAFVLESLERFLTELAHLQPDAGADLEALLGRLESTDLLFKVRVLGTELEERTREQGSTT